MLRLRGPLEATAEIEFGRLLLLLGAGCMVAAELGVFLGSSRRRESAHSIASAQPCDLGLVGVDVGDVEVAWTGRRRP